MEEPGEYRKLAIKRFPAAALRETTEGKYWTKFQSPKVLKQIGAVSSIHFKEEKPHNFAVTAGTRVLLYDCKTQEVKRTFSRFQDKAYSGNLRSDGKVMVAGGETGVVQLFDCSSRSVLRQLKGHQKPCHVAMYSPDKVHVLSGGDDVTVRWWDVAEGKQVSRLDGHSDYVRAAACSPASDTTWLTGGYDHVVKLWDVRQKESVLEFQHGAPVEAAAFFPSGSIAVTAGGNHLCVWDLLGGKLLKRLSNHQKTVSCVVVSAMAGPQSSATARLLSGSLDGHVKVYELDTFKVTHASKYPAPILSLGLSPDNSLLAVGMADGNLSLRRHRRPSGEPVVSNRRHPRLTAANYRFFIRGQSEKASRGDFVIARRRKAKLAPFDRLLRRFHYRDALDTALATKRPEVVATVLEELAQRGGVKSALGGRDAPGLLPLVNFLCRHVSNPRHMRLVVGISNRVLNSYSLAIGMSQEVDMKMQLLREKLLQEVKLQTGLQMLQGMIEPLLAASLPAAVI
mmetsp:Transcript_38583/g.109118  ORF Transcript_38583/g.109118 Transcript_38583/m.109118 type:complete len:511 (-) Transcript_38583:107-1639(-)